MRLHIALSLVCCCLIPLEARGQIANILGSVGAINQSMGGAATAMPLDASGSQYWNPASITDLEETELDINVQPFFPKSDLSATLQANSLAPGLPPVTLSDDLENHTRFAVAPSIAYVKKLDSSPWRFGFLVTGIAGSSVDFPKNRDNPITSPPPIGSGHIKISGDFLQISPTIAYKLNEHWSLGVQPNFDLASLKAKPFGGTEPRDDNGDGIPTYPKTDKAWSTGIGVQGGIYYHNKGLHLGTAIKSPQWFLPYHLDATYENGVKRKIIARTNLPMIVSAGIGYSGIPRVKIAVDGRYLDFANTTGFDQVGFTSANAGKGPGWKSIWALASGIQYQLTEKCLIRGGYSYNQSPIQSRYTSFAIASPSVIEQFISFGMSYRFNHRFTLAAAYNHGFSGSKQGPLQSPVGPIPGSNIKLRTSINTVVFSLIFKY